VLSWRARTMPEDGDGRDGLPEPKVSSSRLF
jgi:hypothetical protein